MNRITFFNQLVARTTAVLAVVSLLPEYAKAGLIPKPSRKCKRILLNKDKDDRRRGIVTSVSKIEFLECWRSEVKRARKKSKDVRQFSKLQVKINQIDNAIRDIRKEQRKFNFTGTWLVTLDVNPGIFTLYYLKHNRRTDMVTGTVANGSGSRATFEGVASGHRVHKHEDWGSGGVCDGTFLLFKSNPKRCRARCDIWATGKLIHRSPNPE